MVSRNELGSVASELLAIWCSEQQMVRSAAVAEENICICWCVVVVTASLPKGTINRADANIDPALDLRRLFFFFFECFFFFLKKEENHSDEKDE